MFGLLYFWGIIFEKLPLVNIEWTFSSFFFSLMTYLSYIFWLDASIFSRKKREKVNSSSIFVELYLNLRRKLRKFINTVDLITWTLKKANSIQTFVEDIPEVKLSHQSLLSKTYENSYSVTRALTILNNFCVLSE